jgi:hypothetical protein
VAKAAKRNPRQIFVVADQYRNGSKWLILAESNGWPHDVRMAGVTCASFALELFLKCLLAMEGKDVPDLHDLWHLFARLNKATQVKVRGNFEPYLMDAGRHIAASAKRAGYPIPTVDFDFVLNASRKAFPLTRYIYEGGLPGGQGWVADGILEAARKTILDAHPDWVDARQISPEVILGVPPIP